MTHDPSWTDGVPASTSRPVALDALTLPLHGSRLIEASAGTGKTYTIASLYVRLVLGHGGEAAFVRPLTPPEILVVTFTDAATQELRDRIRARLAQAAALFDEWAIRHLHGEPAIRPDDPLLAGLQDDYDASQWPACARRLRLAAEWMDEAAVSTIHGWCYRMLREHAFDSGSLFEQTLITDEQDLLAQAVRDYWRRNFYGLSTAAAARVLSCFKGPDALADVLRPLLGRRDARFVAQGQAVAPQPSLHTTLQACEQWASECERLEHEVRRIFLADIDGVRDLLVAMRPDLNARSFPEKKTDESFDAWLVALAHWAATGEGAEGLKLERLAFDRIKLNGKKPTPEHAAWSALQALEAHRQQSPELAPSLIVHALGEVTRALAQAKQRRAELGFDDLLAQLDMALAADGAGRRLAVSIRQRFPVALIDEFQDTDPLQYRIFERIYTPQQDAAAAHTSDMVMPVGAVTSAASPAALLMIGDPKQAIYSFRGADIHTYLRARQATAGRHYTLGTNYRSTVGMVEAVNHCFAYAEGHAAGAFRFAREGDNPVPFVRVAARGRSERLVIDGRPATPLTAWLLQGETVDALVGVTTYRQQMAERCASAVCAWLNQSGQGRTGFRTADGELLPLRPADIAVLVRGRTEAEAIRHALARRQLASVYLSDRDSVFNSAEARDVLWWLQACAEPSNDGRLRTALATASMDLDWGRLDRLNHDEFHWEDMVQRVQGYRRMWRGQGVLPMLRHWLADFDVAARLLALPQGERRLTNILHVAEWLQRESLELDGEHALIRALAEQIAQPSDEEILRLESDADLIKVITIHKSKGLEYPLVLLPFIAAWRDADVRSQAVAYQAQEPADAETAGSAGDREATVPVYTVELSRSKDAVQSARRLAGEERLAEDMRLLYVALTRARHAVWLGVAPLVAGAGKSCELHKGALGYMLNGDSPIDAACLPGVLEDWRKGRDAGEPGLESAIEIVSAPEIDTDTVFEPVVGIDRRPGAARVAQASMQPRWWIASYSALRVGSDAVAMPDLAGVEPTPAQPADAAGGSWPEPASPREADLREETAQRDADLIGTAVLAGALRPEAAQADAGSLHAFPKGAEAGSFLHDLLEFAARQGLSTVAAEPGVWAAEIERRCRLRGWSQWNDLLQHWLPKCLSVPLLPHAGPASFALKDLQIYQGEMEFWFAATQVDTLALDRLVTRGTLEGVARPALLADQLNGMLKGYMDLVCQHDGRFYIVDYKSNWLGPDESFYTPQTVRRSMLAHRYDLQYTLYLLALHRLLASRLPDYDYDRDIGGAVYLFMRGVDANGEGVLFDKPDRALIEALDMLFGGQEPLRDFGENADPHPGETDAAP